MTKTISPLLSLMATTDPIDLKALSSSLSNSYSSILQHASLSKDQVLHHLDQLSTYSNHLPLTWFTDALLHSLLALERTFDDDNVHGLASVMHLLSVWTRRLTGSVVTERNESLVVTVLKLFSHTLMSLDPLAPSTLAIRKDCWLGLVSFVGCAPKAFDEQTLLAAMTGVIQLYAQQTEDTHMAESLEAGVAHALATSTTLNVFELEHCQHLLEALVQLEARRFPQGVWSMALLIEHAVDIRSQLKPATRAQADLESLYALAENIVTTPDASFVKVAIVAGLVRMLQFNQGEKTKKIQEVSTKAQGLFITHFEKVLQHTIDPRQSASFAANQDVIAYFSGQCLPNLPVETIKELDLKALLEVLVSFYATSDQLWKNGQLLHQLEDAQRLVDLQQNPLYKEIGRISRAIGKVIHVALDKDIPSKVIQDAIDRLDGLSYNVFLDWDRYISEKENSTAETQKAIESNMWAIFKTMVFAYTAILKAVAVDVVEGRGLIQVPFAAQGILSIYGNLNFINEKLGSANGFQAYQDTLTNSVAYLKHKDNTCQLNKFMSLSFREYRSHTTFTPDQTPPVDLLSPVQRQRLLFFMNLAEQVMPELDEKVVEQDILPVLYPILKWKTIIDKDLYESAHAATLSIFAAQKPVSRELAGGYASLLINNFPEPLTHHQLRLAYVTMVQSLCELDDAVAWLTVQHVLEKINHLDQGTVRSEFLVLLIDLLKPLSLGPFFGQALAIVEQQIKQLETTNMQRSTLKIVFETVSGSGISDMRRIEAVGWYLELKRQLLL